MGVASHELVDNPYVYNTIGQYKNWFPAPASITHMPPPKHPDFLHALGRSTAATLGYPSDLFRAAFIGPKRTILRNYGEGALSWGLGKLLRDPEMVQNAYTQWGPQAYLAPLERARLERLPWQGSLGDWAQHNIPSMSEMVTLPKQYFRNIFASGPVEF